MVNRVAEWLREIGYSDNVDTILARCKVAAGEIDRLESMLESEIKTNYFLQTQLQQLKNEKTLWWKMKRFILGSKNV